jgi:hypothetical protein
VSSFSGAQHALLSYCQDLWIKIFSGRLVDQFPPRVGAVLVTHRMAATACADIILVLQKGKLVEMGTHAQLLDAQGEYFRLHDLQAGGTDRAAPCPISRCKQNRQPALTPGSPGEGG